MIFSTFQHLLYLLRPLKLKMYTLPGIGNECEQKCLSYFMILELILEMHLRLRVKIIDHSALD